MADPGYQQGGTFDYEAYKKQKGNGFKTPWGTIHSGDISNWWNTKHAPQMSQNPYLSQWGSLIGQLQNTAAGRGPSLAGNAYNEAHANAVHDQMSMAAGGSAGAARQAGMNIGRQNQGLAAGYSNARLQEQMAAQQSLQGALSGAGNAWFQPQAANLQAQLGTQTNGQQLLNFIQQAGPALASMF